MANIDMGKMHEFIDNWFKCKEDGVIERKSFTRFKAAMPPTMDTETVEAAYKQFTGDNPRYNKDNGYPAYKLKEYASKCHEVADALTHDPMSFADAYNKAFHRPNHYGAPNDDALMRKCFKAAAKAHIIGMMQISTCGKCHIRLFYAK